MDKKFARYSLAVRFVSCMILSFALCYAVDQYFTLQVPIYFILLAILVIEAFALVVDVFKKKPALWIAIGVVIAALLILPQIFGVRMQEIINQSVLWMKDSFSWLEAYTASLKTESPMEIEVYRSLFIICLPIIASVIVFYPLTKFYPTRLILGLLLLAGLIAWTVTKHDLNWLSLFCILVYLVSCVLEICNRQLDHIRTEKKPFSALFLYPVCIILALFSILLPSKEEPIQWTAVKNLLSTFSESTDAIGDRFRIIFGQVPADFSIEFNEINLSGNKSSLDANSRETIVKVKPNVLVRSDAYIRGSVKSDYTGTGWIDRSEEFLENDAQMEIYEVMYSLRREGLTTDEDEDLYHRLTFEIEYADLITKSLLYSPLYMNAEYDAKGSFDYYGANIRFRNFRRTGWTYEQTFYETNWGSENLKNHLRSLDGFDYDEDRTDFESLRNTTYSAFHEINSSFINVNRDIFNADIAQLLAARADIIDDLYRQLPATIPDRVYQLAAELCDTAETEYDAIMAVESFFQDNGYGYTLAPNPMPEEQDFVDWLIFEEKQGYCSYYATAATVLLRAAGIPARYVEGVLIESGTKSSDVVEVSGRSAHAWCEAYIEGYGWIVVDATPGYGVGRDTEWARKQINHNQGTSVETPPPIPEQPPVEEDVTPPEEMIDPAELARLEAERQAARRRLWTILSISLAVVLVVGLTVGFAAYKNTKRKRYRRASDSDKIVMLMRDILLYVGAADKKIDPNQTVLEFVEQAGLGYDSYEMTLEQAAMLYLKIRYSRAEATHMDVVALFRYRRDLRKTVLRTTGLFARFRFQLQETL